MPYEIVISTREPALNGLAQNLSADLKRRFGQSAVASTVEALVEPGQALTEAVQDGVKAANILIVLVGSQWSAGAWYDAKRDPHRIALATALQEKKRILPVLVNGASLPSEKDLPDWLDPLLERTTFTLSSATFDSDAKTIASTAEKILASVPKPASAPKPAPVPAPPFVPYTPPSAARTSAPAPAPYLPYTPTPPAPKKGGLFSFRNFVILLILGGIGLGLTGNLDPLIRSLTGNTSTRSTSTGSSSSGSSSTARATPRPAATAVPALSSAQMTATATARYSVVENFINNLFSRRYSRAANYACRSVKNALTSQTDLDALSRAFGESIGSKYEVTRLTCNLRGGIYECSVRYVEGFRNRTIELNVALSTESNSYCVSGWGSP
jgi:hypothetical protein